MVLVAVEFEDQYLNVTIEMKATEQNIPAVLFIMLHKFGSNSEFVDEIAIAMIAINAKKTFIGFTVDEILGVTIYQMKAMTS